MPTKRALLIGINEYPHLPKKKQLHGCVNDVVSVQRLLTGTFGFLAENITLLNDKTDEKPTHDGILKALNALVDKVEDDDIVIIFYAGHGSRRKNSSKPNHYSETIVPRDSGRRSVPGFAEAENKDITDDELHAVVSRAISRTSNIVWIIDACRAEHEHVSSAIVRCVKADESESAKSSVVKADASSEPFKGFHGGAKGRQSGWFAFTDSYVVLAACAADEIAVEKKLRKRHRGESKQSRVTFVRGAWTYQFCHAATARLSAEGAHCRYRDVVEQASIGIGRFCSTQHPVGEGDVDRQLFGEKSVKASPYGIVLESQHSTKGRVKLSLGAKHGVAIGAKFALCNKHTKHFHQPRTPAEEQSLCVVEVCELSPLQSFARAVNQQSKHLLRKVEKGMRAFEVSRKFDLQLHVRVRVSPEIKEWVKLENSPVTPIQLQEIEERLKTDIRASTLLHLVADDDEKGAAIVVHMLPPRSGKQKGGDEEGLFSNVPFPFFALIAANNDVEMPHPISLVETAGRLMVIERLGQLGRLHTAAWIQHKVSRRFTV